MKIMPTKNSVVITSALRTAIGSFGGTLKNIPAHDLGATVISESLNKSNLKKALLCTVICIKLLT